MPDLARKILNAVEGGDIEAIRQGDSLHLLLALRPVVSVPANPHPEVGVTSTNLVRVISGVSEIDSIQADSAEDARIIAETIQFCFWTCKEPIE